MTDLRLDGRTVLVTGAGRGLGAAIAQGLADLGAVVYGSSRDAEEAARIAERYGTEPVVLDVTDAQSAAGVVSDLTASAGIDLLVNNAGVNVPQAALDVDSEAWDIIHGTNSKGLFFVSQAVARVWVEKGVQGAIVNVGSQAGSVAIENRVAYGSSKAAAAQVTRNLAFEWGRYGIRVNAIAPTFIRTELTESTLTPDFAEALLARIPLGRLGDPEDVVGATAFLLSDLSRMVTGHVLFVDGGYTIH